MNDCIFCKIAGHNIPKEFLYEDDTVMVFDDIHPIKPIHVLIVSKQHIEDFGVLTDSVLWNHMREVMQKMVLQLQLEKKGYRITFHGGGAQVIDHLHAHLIGPLGKAVTM